ncbi:MULTISPECIES: LolA-like protein [Streptomyces]|uniref:hypothetical protein n=1 Tax=Streptomyces TaxID=1883 RepID=UPI00069B0B3A|nr:hypothetical protein [Streptomyces sp. SID7805]MYU52542.1 hypothetical protein [Streptomyces sp. SID7805]
MKTIRKTAMAVTSAALIMGLTACGSDTKSSEGKDASSRPGDATGKRADAPAVLKAALEKMAQQNSYRTVETGKTGSEPESRAEMTFQNEPEATETKTFGGKSKGAASGGTHILSVGGVLYLATSDVPGKSWYTMEDLDSAPKPSAPSQGKSREKPKENPERRVQGAMKKWVSALLAVSKDLRHIGRETVGSRAADHYRGTVVLADLERYEGPAMTKDYRDLYLLQTKKSGMDKAQIDVWVDEDGLIVKEEEKGRTPKGDERITEEFSDYGVDPKIKAPDRKDVASWSEYVASAGKKYRTHS